MQVADGAGINGCGALRRRVNGGNASVGPGEIWIDSSEPPLAGVSAFVPVFCRVSALIDAGRPGSHRQVDRRRWSAAQ